MKLFCWFTLALAALWVAPPTCVSAQDSEGDGASEEVRQDGPDTFDSLMKEFSEFNADFAKSRSDLSRRMAAAKENEERQGINQEFMELQNTFQTRIGQIGERMFALINDETEIDEATKILTWLLQNVRDESIQEQTAKFVVAKFLNRSDALGVVRLLGAGLPMAAKIDALKLFGESGTTEEIRGTALMSIAEAINTAQGIGLEKGVVLSGLSPETSAYLYELSQTTTDELVGMYQDLAEKYGEVTFRNGTIGKVAGQKIKAIEIAAKLKIGAEAPDIEGPDIDGEVFKLSDYRGKVVMLDFWGDW